MHIVILGCSGLIGHKLYQVLAKRFDQVTGVLHGSLDRFNRFRIFASSSIVENVSVEDKDSVFSILNHLQPDVVLNCAGITRRRPEIDTPIKAIAVNALFPHLLAEWAGDSGARVIHFSTDCVFDGSVGNYQESSEVSPEDAYGRTKALGEIRYDHTLTIRSSFIGQELDTHSELLAWFLQQSGKQIGGFTHAMYSGVSTSELSRVVGDIIEKFPDLSGLYNLSIEEPISKYDLLCLARDAYSIDVEINKDSSLVTNPTLDGSKLRKAINLKLPDWEEMMCYLASQKGFYQR
ncbi:MAG: dTDP-4-dehydrorhamnose reductase family protein [Rhizobiaceae bacterium]